METVNTVTESVTLFFLHEIWQYIIIAALIITISIFIKGIVTRLIFRLTLKLFPRSAEDVVKNYFPAFEKPLRALIVILGIYLAFLYMPLTAQQDLLVTTSLRSSLVIIVAWGLHGLTGTYSIMIEGIGKRLNMSPNEPLIPFLSKFIRFIVIALAIAIVAGELGFDINGFIAGLGLGGLAIALAAQDTLSNIFGGIVIITDKPFAVGDWIATSSVEGTVEDISFRSTRIRTFANSVTIIPNSVLAKEAITNWSRMGKRRITFNLGVTFTTPKDKLETCVNRIKSMLQNHPGVHQETIFVRFDTFNDSSLDIFLYFFTITTSWGEFLEVKEDINFKIMEILEEEGVSVAFPSRSIYFENELKRLEESSES